MLFLSSFNWIRFACILSAALLLTNCGGGGSNTTMQDEPIDVSPDEGTPELQSVDSSGNYRLIWADEFNENSLNAENWTPELGYGSNGWGNDESQLYTSSEDNVKVENGNLLITALPEDLLGQLFGC